MPGNTKMLVLWIIILQTIKTQPLNNDFFFFHTHISLFTARSKCKQVVRGPKFLLCQKTVSWVGLQSMYNSYAFGAVVIKTVLGFIHLPVMPPCFRLCPSLALFYWMEYQHQTEWHFTLPFKSIDEHSRDCQPLAELRCVGQDDPGCLCAGGNNRGPYFLVLFLFVFND